MKDEGSPRKNAASRKPRAKRPSRKLNFVSRVRGRFRRGANRILAADAVWSSAFVVVVMLLLGSQHCAQPFERVVVDAAAPYDITASYDVDIVDRELSEQAWRQARENTIDVYTLDAQRRARLTRELTSVFEQGRLALEQASLRGDSDPQAAALKVFGDRIPSVALQALVAQSFDAELERELTNVLSEVMSERVVGNKSLLQRQPTIELLHFPDETSETIEDYGDILDVSEARERVRRELDRRIELPREQVQALSDFAAAFVDANVHLDAERTDRRREEAVSRVPPVRVRLARGTVLVKKGDIVTQEVIDRLKEARLASSGPFGLREFVGLLVLTCMLAFFLYRYSRYHQRAFRKIEHLHALLVLMLLSMLLMAQAVLWLASVVVDDLGRPFNALDLYTYLIPLGVGAILVTLLANGRIAMVYSSFGALLFGAVHGFDFHLTVWATVVQLSGVYAISAYRERKALLLAGLVVGGAGAVTALAVETLQGNLEPYAESLYGAGLAFVGGAVGVGLLISFSLPLLEALFNVLTDIRLLELSNLNNPLLSQLAVKAPGSYNHSLVVGTLAEEGAKAIGANSLFCRVAAFYHDVGKISHAEYYVENQRGTNPHDRLSPSMSALIIASHVKDGIKMAREAGLPEQIIDIIPQHHGTKLMTYFYEKAKTSADPSMGPVKQEDFRYPGPKPQTREAAIFMIADAVEAAARTVDEPTANRLREMIRKVTNSIVLDRQFDACDLTFADLDKIQQAFLKLLVGMYHHRVDYPGFDFGKKAKGKPVAEVPDQTAARGS